MAPKKTQETTPRTPRDKDELFWKILDAALRLEITRGHLRWKMTDLSRASGVTRSLIYYYFGHAKEAILQAAIDILGEEFFGLSESRQSLWEQGKISESVQKSRQLMKNTPHISIFYLNQRQDGSPFAAQMAALERRYVQKLASHFPKVDPAVLPAVFATFFGLVTVSDLPDDVLHGVVTSFIGTISRPRAN